MTNLPVPSSSPDPVPDIRAGLDAARSSRGRRIGEAVVLAGLGVIPWVGGFLAAAASLPGAEADAQADELRRKWLEEHERKIGLLFETFDHLNARFEALGPPIQERVESQEYLGLVRQAFREWDNADTEQKRRLAANILVNSAGTRVCSDDVVRLFISWLSLYHESHFAVIKEIHENPGSTRYGIWSEIYGGLPREDSAEADLYKMLIRDLSTGGVIRQVRDTNEAGQFVRKKPARRRGHAPTTMESAFEDSKQYTLTELGKQFVHYAMNESVTRLGTS